MNLILQGEGGHNLLLFFAQIKMYIVWIYLQPGSNWLETDIFLRFKWRSEIRVTQHIGDNCPKCNAWTRSLVLDVLRIGEVKG